MKLIIAGSRDQYATPAEISERLDLLEWKPTEIVSGGARGIDRAGEQFANVKRIPVKPFPAAWTRLDAPGAVIKRRPDGSMYNAAAGHARNQLMAEYADTLLAFWDGTSPGTADMIERMTALGKPLFVVPR